MRSLRALVVDDSVFDRRAIMSVLGELPDVEVVGKAVDGNEALKLAASLQPDFITLDLEMPKMDGFSFLRLLMARQPTAVLVVSGRSEKTNVFKALELGALDFIAKPGTDPGVAPRVSIRQQLIEKVAILRQLTPLAVRSHVQSTKALARVKESIPSRRPAGPEKPPTHLVALAASTGGPPALVNLFGRLPADLPAAVVVIQHMPAKFTKTFAQRLDRLQGLKVDEAQNGQVLKAGHAYVCPGGQCLEMKQRGNDWTLQVHDPDPKDRYVPSADRFLKSAARVSGDKTLAVILTGMGDDGADGARDIKKVGGRVLAESNKSAAIYGMPGSAVDAGAVDDSFMLDDLATQIVARTLDDKPKS